MVAVGVYYFKGRRWLGRYPLGQTGRDTVKEFGMIRLICYLGLCLLVASGVCAGDGDGGYAGTVLRFRSGPVRLPWAALTWEFR